MEDMPLDGQIPVQVQKHFWTEDDDILRSPEQEGDERWLPPELIAGGGGNVCPYTIGLVNDSGGPAVTVVYGTLTGDVLTESGHTTFGGVPKISRIEIGSSPDPELSLTNNATNVILLKVTTDHIGLIKDADILAYISTALPVNVEADYVAETDGEYWLEIGRVDVDAGGVASNARNAWCGSVSFKYCGDGNVKWSILFGGSPFQET